MSIEFNDLNGEEKANPRSQSGIIAAVRQDASSAQFGIEPDQFNGAGLIPFLFEHRKHTKMNSALK